MPSCFSVETCKIQGSSLVYVHDGISQPNNSNLYSYVFCVTVTINNYMYIKKGDSMLY